MFVFYSLISVYPSLWDLGIDEGLVPVGQWCFGPYLAFISFNKSSPSVSGTRSRNIMAEVGIDWQFSAESFSHHLFNYSDQPAALRESPHRAKYMRDVGERPQTE